MNTVQPQFRQLHSLPVKTGKLAFKTINGEKLSPINDARHRAVYRTNTGRTLLAIFLMLGLISYLVWNLG